MISAMRICWTAKIDIICSPKIQKKLFFRPERGSGPSTPNPLLFAWAPRQEDVDDPGVSFMFAKLRVQRLLTYEQEIHDACITYRITPLLSRLMVGKITMPSKYLDMLLLDRPQELSRLYVERQNPDEQCLSPQQTEHWLERRGKRTLGQLLRSWFWLSTQQLLRDGFDPMLYGQLRRETRLWLPIRPDDFDDEGDYIGPEDGRSASAAEEQDV